MNTRQFSHKQEERVAKLVNGKVVANSGATAFNKGDVIVKQLSLLIECKTSAKPKESFSIKKEWLEKNKKEAFSMGIRNTIVAIDFGSSDDYFIIDKKLMQLLLEKLDEEQNSSCKC